MLTKMLKKGNLVHCWWECKWVQPLWKTVRSFLKKLKIFVEILLKLKVKKKLPYELAIPLQGIHMKIMKTII